MRSANLASWGRYPRAVQGERPIFWRSDPLPRLPGTVLPRGRGRSYGDCCLDDGGTLLTTRALDRLIAFDPESGCVACEAGVTIDDLLRWFVPRGWFPPVVPGTRHVTIGGAIANDIHGKNHHRAGTFGRHVRRLELLRSDGARILCEPGRNAEWFAATVGGLGLTGLITWAELQLRRIPGELLSAETIPFGGLDEYVELARRSDDAFEYTVAWVDSMAPGRRAGRGLFFRANHVEGSTPGRRSKTSLDVPFTLPGFVLNRWTARAFNAGYALAHRRVAASRMTHLDSFFFPLDGVRHWNRVYGPRGLVQLQCALPQDGGIDGIRTILDRIARAGAGSFLAVLKTFGDARSPGRLSFPRPGLAVALDLPNRGDRTAALMRDLHACVVERGGAIYPAKDAHMTPATFAAGYPRWSEHTRFVDPSFSSSLWRRVTGGGAGR
jgi:FAD/FMN-containing dehydrogenase